MQRLHRVLLLISIAVGVAVCLGLDEAEALLSRALADPPQPQRLPAPPSTPYEAAQPWMQQRSSVYPTTDAAPWAPRSTPAQPADTAGEAEVSDIPVNPSRFGMPSPVGQPGAVAGPPSNYPGYPQTSPGFSIPLPPQRDVSRPPVEARLANAPKGQNAPAPIEAVPCEGAQIIARVGTRVILASEIMPPVNEILDRYKGKIPPAQLEVQRKLLIRELLKRRIELQRVYYDAERTIPAENMTKFKEKLGEQFETVEVPRRIKEAKLDSRRELEEKMIALGTSLEREKRAYAERYIYHQWLQQQGAATDEISHEELLAYYQAHLADFEHPARARWEQLTVHKSSHQSNAEARAKLARMGNQVIQGAPFAEVAKKGSQGPTASQGGAQDWTTKGSLVSEPLDQALFGLPVGKLSQIIEDSQGFHIIRVTEREDASRTPFEQAQHDIRKKIGEQREKDAREKYLAKLSEEIPVWTIFDNDPAPTSPATTSTSPFLQR